MTSDKTFTFKMKLIKKVKNSSEQLRYLVFLFAIISSIFLLKHLTEKKDEKRIYAYSNFFNHEKYETIKNYLLKGIKSPYTAIQHQVKSGDTLEKILKKYKIEHQEINSVIKLLKKTKNLKKLFVGNSIYIVLKKKEAKIKSSELEEITIPITKTINIKVTKSEDDKFIIEKIVTKLYKKTIFAENTIKNNLYSSAIEAKIEPNTIVDFARIYGFEIDFQRDIRKNDTFQILYEKFFDENGEFVKSGSIIFASMIVNDRKITLYKFGKDKDFGYFDSSGKSVEKALMKTPINGARLSSSFGMRKHPISGFTKMHQGTDFAAPAGTPIMASGSGTVILAKWCGGGGNCIKIKHNSTYSTIYAHLKNFARGIKKGRKIRQGQIIGYVGSTGISTGPHLHYEVIVNGKKVNSQKLRLPSGKVLKGNERKSFEVERIKIDVLVSEVIEKQG